MDYLEIIRQAEEAHQPMGLTKRALQPPSGKPGDRITWGTNGTLRGPATINFLHTDPDGVLWAFYTQLDGSWGAVNMKYVTTRSEGGR